MDLLAFFGSHLNRIALFCLYDSYPRAIELRQIFPRAGWVEIDPAEIFAATLKCIIECCDSIKVTGYDITDIKAIGICNQRETTILWDGKSGKPLYNAICWLDDRTTDLVHSFIEKTSNNALKIRWLLNNVDNVKDALKRVDNF
ncbi:carbohydrate kinase, FGGY family protein [Onchocerca flexuosa]|uniref:Carbohydrate kinase, FGGY family protein n=1 Tax=Onchocerca flexuosa TaxID=387005 RepID=A0A238BXR5_9BILA|nr:carbohydrate kinase, FGGY family protein [Onchocerca flexuosa]